MHLICLNMHFLIHFHHIFSHDTKTDACLHVHVKTLQRINKHWTPALIRKSLNMYLLLITLEINSSGRAVTGARCYWQTAVAVTDNTRCLSILHCNPPICLSPPRSSPSNTPPLPRSASPSSAPPFSFSQVGREMTPEPKHLSQQQSTGAKLHRKGWRGRCGQRERMRGQGTYETKVL